MCGRGRRKVREGGGGDGVLFRVESGDIATARVCSYVQNWKMFRYGAVSKCVLSPRSIARGLMADLSGICMVKIRNCHGRIH